MTEVAEPIQPRTDNASVRDRMIETAVKNKAAIAAANAESAKETEPVQKAAAPVITADTVADAVVKKEPVVEEPADSAALQVAAEKLIADNNLKIEAEKKEAAEATALAEAGKAKLAAETAAKETPAWYDESEKPEVDLGDDNKAAIDPELETKAKAYDELLNDKFVKAYTSAKKSGKNITSFIKEVAPLDVDSIPDKQLFVLSLQKAGLTTEEMEIENDAFDNYTPLQKKRAVAEIKESLRKEDGDKLAQYITDNEVDQAKNEEYLKKYKADKSEFLSKLKTKEDYMGLKLNQSDIEQAMQYVEHGFPTTRKDGTYNLPSMFELAVFRSKKKEIAQSLINKGVSLGREALLKELSRTDRNDGAGKVLPDVTVENKGDKAKEIMRNKYAPKQQS